MDVHTHTVATHTHRFAITFWNGKKLIKTFKLQQKVKKKPKKVLIVASFEGEDKKA